MSKQPTIAEHLKAIGVSRRSFIQLCGVLMATAPGGPGADQQQVGPAGGPGDRQDEAAVGDLAAFPGLHGMHGDSAAHFRS